MSIIQKIEKLGNEQSNPCVTISMNTHRTHPDNEKDKILLKNLLTEAENRVVKEFGKRETATLVKNIKDIEKEIDVRFNLESLHIFLSENTKEYIRTTWAINQDSVSVSNSFSFRHVIKAYNRDDEYLIMLLSRGGVTLYDALNADILDEIKNEDFPFAESPYFVPNPKKASDPKYVDSMIHEFLNKVDKALVKVAKQKDLKCIVICTEGNYRHLMQVVDRPDVYIGHATIDYNNSEPHQVVKQAWEIVKQLQKDKRTAAISEMKESVSQRKVLTDLQEIYRAVIDGRGDLLIARQDFVQPVRMKDERSFELLSDGSGADSIEDITSTIAWRVLSKKGRVVFTTQDEIKDLGNIVLKLRY